MSRPLMTAWATISSIGWRALRLHQRRTGVFLREDARQIAFLPLHADRVAVHVLAVRTEFYFSAWRHRRKAGRHVERRERLAHLLRIGRLRPLERIDDHEGLRDEAAAILEQEFAVTLLVFGVHFLRVGVGVVIPVRHALQALGEI